jgi:hypothetical protein
MILVECLEHFCSPSQDIFMLLGSVGSEKIVEHHDDKPAPDRVGKSGHVDRTRGIITATIALHPASSHRMAARVEAVTDPAEGQKILSLLMKKYPEQKNVPIAMPKPSDVRLFRVTPTVISVLDYSKGFGHTDLCLL